MFHLEFLGRVSPIPPVHHIERTSNRENPTITKTVKDSSASWYRTDSIYLNTWYLEKNRTG